MTSVSSFGTSQITLQFTLDRNIDAAEQDVQAAINAAATFLPAHAAGAADLQQEQPRRHADPHSGGQLGHAAAPSRSTTSPIRSWRKRSRRCPGVGLVTINGGQKPAVRVRVDPEALAGVGPQPGGRAQVWSRPTSTSPRATSTARGRTSCSGDQRSALQGRRRSVHWCSPTATARAGAAAGRRQRRRRRRRTPSSRAGPTSKRAIILNVQRQPGANVIKVAERVKALLPQLATSMPEGIDSHDPQRPHRDRARLGATTCSSRSILTDRAWWWR